MSRNLEKAQSELHRFQQQKNREAGVLESNPKLRPKNTKSVKNVSQAERWRAVVMGEISLRLTMIQDPTASDETLRELNTALTLLFKEKRAWEYQIKDLGGIDHLSQRDSIKGQTANGIRYYGRAKELPEVQQVLKAQKLQREQQIKQQQVKLKKVLELQQRRLKITEKYYGLAERVDRKLDLDEANITPLGLFKERTPINAAYKLQAFKQSQNGLVRYERRRTRQLSRDRV